MKIFRIFFLVVISISSTMTLAASPTQTSPSELEQIKALVTSLALLTEKADACGEHLNYFGKKALEGEVCKEFSEGFYSLWPDRESLQYIIEDYIFRLERGLFKCDNCDTMLQRAEELRITITYYLDYMDFVKDF